mgnify:CR=1 FL=1
MKLVIQRCESASVSVDGKIVGQIGQGFLVLLGIGQEDTEADCDRLAAKMIGLRIFSYENGKTNLSLKDVGGSLLVISQFTLYGDASHGRRPSFTEAARPEVAIPLYEKFVELCRGYGVRVATGRFGAEMLVSIRNDGPVTILAESR